MSNAEIESITKNLEISYADFQSEPSQKNKNNMLNSMLKICQFYAQEGDYKSFEKIFISVRNLEGLTFSEEISKLLAECFFKLTAAARNMIFQQPEILDGLFTLMIDLKMKTPCREYVCLYKSVHKFRKPWKGYLDFCRWWNMENFMDEDYVIEAGSKMSLAESALIFFTKRVINSSFDEDFAKLALTFIRKKIKYNLSVYSNYYIAKLLLRLKFNNEQIRSVLRPFIKEKPLKPWGWHLMSKTFYVSNNFNEKYACLLLALNVGKDFKEEILNGIYLDLALMFKDLNKFGNAKFFFEIYFRIKKKYKHKIPEFIIKIARENWYQSVISERPNTSFDYKEVCREIYRQIRNIDSVMMDEVSQKLENDFHETIQWSSNWYETMEE